MQVEGLDVSFSAHKIFQVKITQRKAGLRGRGEGAWAITKKNSCTANTAENKNVI